MQESGHDYAHGFEQAEENHQGEVEDSREGMGEFLDPLILSVLCVKKSNPSYSPTQRPPRTPRRKRNLNHEEREDHEGKSGA
jgi:hypothetical protein